MDAKTKNIVVGVAFILITTWVVDYFVLSRFRIEPTSGIKSGQAFSAPEEKQIIRPFNVGITFSDKKRTSSEVVTEVSTDWADLVFSSDGASLERLEFKHGAEGNERISTIYPAIKKEHKAFLVALNEASPYYFNVVDMQENDAVVLLTYEGLFADGILRKRFLIDKQRCKIDLTIEVALQSNNNRDLELRVFYPAPVMPDVKCDAISAVISNVKGSIEKIPYKKLNAKEGWWSPTLFGAENKYFVHALIADADNFADRAYFMTTADNYLISIAESAVVQERQKSWTLSFYCGPKDAHAMSLVDDRLEETLDYSGILAPLSKLLLKILKFLYGYIGNYGLAIILLTFLIKMIMLPFTISGERGIKKSADIQKKMHYLQQQYKNDPERLRLEQAELIKKHGMPQLTGCLPLLLQFPIFIALSRILGNSVELYKAPFAGWITDLSAPDPYYILPLIIIVAMMVQGLTGDPKQRMMTMSMALVFGAISANFAAGLVIYICASTLLGLVQTSLQKVMKVS